MQQWENEMSMNVMAVLMWLSSVKAEVAVMASGNGSMCNGAIGCIENTIH